VAVAALVVAVARVAGPERVVGAPEVAAGAGRPPVVPAARSRRAATAARAPALVTAQGIAAARRWARRRQGTVAFAVLDERGRLRGLRRTAPFPSASVSKAMLLVAVLRQAGARPLSAGTTEALRAMITISDNQAATVLYARVGGAGLQAVARAAHAQRFADVGHWSDAQLTAADQARFFLAVDRLVPARHRRFARRLLSSITGPQRWGIAPVAARRGLRVFFKGGWRAGITHQVALLERGRHRVALAVLTSGAPSMAYGEQTVAGIAARVLR
jgi:uncharacterized protein GlcG (DUF336 family)